LEGTDPRKEVELRMIMAERIKAVCKKQHDADGSVLPPQVCLFCYGCPIATITAGVTGAKDVEAWLEGGDPFLSRALDIPDKNVPEVEAWLNKIEQKITAGSRR